MQPAVERKHVVVIGAGIIGASIALRLVQEGHRVTILEPGEPGGTQAASYGNGAFLSPASIIPMSAPGLWRKVPGYLLDPTGALTIRWRYLPRLMPWLWRFLASGWTETRVERTAAALSGLLQDAPARHVAQAEAVGRADLIRRDGLIYAFADRDAFREDAFSWRLRDKFGVISRELEEPELRERLPDLSTGYRFGILVEGGGHCLDPGRYTAALVAGAVRGGAELVRADASGFDISSGKLRAVHGTSGDILCDAAVIAAGVRSKRLALTVGDNVSLESERGYSIEISDPGIALSVPVMPQDGRMANTMTANGLRAAGQVELASEDAPPNWHRTDILLEHLRRTWPGLALKKTPRRWQGNRPSTPDGRPVIGAARGCAQVFHAFGHGHIGLASAPMTAEIVAALIGGREPPLDLAPFSPARFG